MITLNEHHGCFLHELTSRVSVEGEDWCQSSEKSCPFGADHKFVGGQRLPFFRIA